jgi:hypothetical protein
VIIETRPEQEIAWVTCVLEIKPEVPIMVCTVDAARQDRS